MLVFIKGRILNLKEGQMMYRKNISNHTTLQKHNSFCLSNISLGNPSRPMSVQDPRTSAANSSWETTIGKDGYLS